MAWSIHGVSLRADNLEASALFFADLIGLGAPQAAEHGAVTFESNGYHLKLSRPPRAADTLDDRMRMQVLCQHLIIATSDLAAIEYAFDRSDIPFLRTSGETGAKALFTMTPAGHVVGFRQTDAPVSHKVSDGWGIHHVNLEAADVRETTAFFTKHTGLSEGTWKAPETRGDFSIEPHRLAVLPLDDSNRGLHIIQPDAGFAIRNGFAHNPSIGGHPAIIVPDLNAVKARLAAADVLVTDAGTFAIPGMAHIYATDPSGNLVEVNQYI